jgi:hypothetical protein
MATVKRMATIRNPIVHIRKPYGTAAIGEGLLTVPMEERWTEIYADEMGVVILEFWKLRDGKPRLRKRHRGVDGFRSKSTLIQQLRAVV